MIIRIASLAEIRGCSQNSSSLIDASMSRVIGKLKEGENSKIYFGHSCISKSPIRASTSNPRLVRGFARARGRITDEEGGSRYALATRGVVSAGAVDARPSATERDRARPSAAERGRRWPTTAEQSRAAAEAASVRRRARARRLVSTQPPPVSRRSFRFLSLVFRTLIFFFSAIFAQPFRPLP